MEGKKITLFRCDRCGKQIWDTIPGTIYKEHVKDIIPVEICNGEYELIATLDVGEQTE